MDRCFLASPDNHLLTTASPSHLLGTRPTKNWAHTATKAVVTATAFHTTLKAVALSTHTSLTSVVKPNYNALLELVMPNSVTLYA
ncbi:MAG: hypothetical protein M1838_005528, partial [Thelocarpon superellum]